jgi:hypothetical protein
MLAKTMGKKATSLYLNVVNVKIINRRFLRVALISLVSWKVTVAAAWFFPWFLHSFLVIGASVTLVSTAPAQTTKSSLFE